MKILWNKQTPIKWKSSKISKLWNHIEQAWSVIDLKIAWHLLRFSIKDGSRNFFKWCLNIFLDCEKSFEIIWCKWKPWIELESFKNWIVINFLLKFSKLRLKLYFSISSSHSTLAWNCPFEPLLRSWISWIFCSKFWESKILIDELSDVLERFDFYLWERLNFGVVAFWIKDSIGILTLTKTWPNLV